VTRTEFFQGIRREVRGAAALFPAAVAERPRDPREAAEIVRRQLAERWPATLARFRAEFERVGGVFHRVGLAEQVPAMVGRLARERDGRRLVSWHPAALGADWGEALAGEGLSVEAMAPGALDREEERAALRARIAEADLGLTGVDLAVAETGSLVLLSGRGRPRSTSLLPPYHVAVFDREALVESLQQVGIFLEAWHGEAGPAWRGGVVNVITGPSRTADIELTLTRGVHGPKEVHAIFVEDGSLAGGMARG
jgi:L-lactate dehydrogenase complex protein LldG